MSTHAHMQLCILYLQWSVDMISHEGAWIVRLACYIEGAKSLVKGFDKWPFFFVEATDYLLLFLYLGFLEVGFKPCINTCYKANLVFYLFFKSLLSQSLALWVEDQLCWQKLWWPVTWAVVATAASHLGVPSVHPGECWCAWQLHKPCRN